MKFLKNKIEQEKAFVNLYKFYRVQWLHGKQKISCPPINTINLIAKKLEVSIDWLCNGNPDFEKTERVLGEQSRTNRECELFSVNLVGCGKKD